LVEYVLDRPGCDQRREPCRYGHHKGIQQHQLLIGVANPNYSLECESRFRCP
jgi:hypothetical protein